MIVITGASATGKTETAKELGSLYDIKKVVTHTTRAKRIGEIDDVDYHFVTKEQFLQLEKEGAFVETTEYNNNFYGTTKKEIADNKVVVCETNGARVWLSCKDPRIVVYRLHASLQARALRMKQRGDDPILIEERLKNDVTRFADDQLKSNKIFEIDTEKYSIKEVANIIYNDYINYLKSLND